MSEAQKLRASIAVYAILWDHHGISEHSKRSRAIDLDALCKKLEAVLWSSEGESSPKGFPQIDDDRSWQPPAGWEIALRKFLGDDMFKLLGFESSELPR